MRRPILSLMVAMGLVAMPRPSWAAAETEAELEAGEQPAAPSLTVAELQAAHAQAQAQVERYNATHDPSHLAAARQLLAQWLVEHRALYGDTQEAASVRAPIEQQLGTIDAELTRVSGAAPAPAVAPAVAPVAAAPPRPVMTPDQLREHKTSRALMVAGTTSLVVGGVSLVTVSLPLWMLRDRALRRANEETFYVDEQRLVSRARRRQAGAIATFGVGALLAGAGVALLAVGGVKRARLRRELSVVPELGRGFAGASVTLRF
jgi:hypothetical protein